MYEPSDYTVDEVNAYLATADDTERSRVLGAETAGKGRVGILHATTRAPDAPAQAPDAPRDTETRGQTFVAAASAATPDDGQGFYGHSPERERTGRADKGLSQQNPAILNGGSVPDARPQVDDSAALAALNKD